MASTEEETRAKNPTAKQLVKVNFLVKDEQPKSHIFLEILPYQEEIKDKISDKPLIENLKQNEEKEEENSQWEVVEKEEIPKEVEKIEENETIPPKIEQTEFHLEKTKFYPYLAQFPKTFQPDFESETFGFTNVGELFVECITWNMQGNAPPTAEEFKNKFIFSKPHIYAVGTQECERSIQMSFLNTSKLKWEKTVYDALNGNINTENNNSLSLLGQTSASDGFANLQKNEDYVQLTSITLLATHLVIFIRKELAQHVKDIKSFSVATGFLDSIGNKGGVMISFELFGTSFIFINCHLSAHQDQVEARNDNYLRIVDELNKKPEFTDFLDIKDRIFFMGDMNYRINGNYRVIESLIYESLKNPDMFEVLWENDQLFMERKKRNVFRGFTEGKLFFKPTYKMVGTEYHKVPENKKKSERIPSWTDRVLFKTNNDKVKHGIHLIDYDSLPEVTMSDHTPVFARFAVFLPNSLSYIKKIQTARRNWKKVKSEVIPSSNNGQEDLNATTRSLSAPQSSICQIQ